MNLVPVQALYTGLATCPVPTSTLVRAPVFLSLGAYWIHWIVKLEKVENHKFTNPCPDREAAADAGQARLARISCLLLCDIVISSELRLIIPPLSLVRTSKKFQE